MSRERLIAVVAAVLVALSLGYYLLSAPALVQPGKPHFHGDQLKHLIADLPQIGTFDSFNLENENPFIPWQERLLEQAPHSVARNTDAFIPTAPAAVVESEQYTPLPRLKADSVPAPRCIGLVDPGDDSTVVLIVHMPGTEGYEQMKIGDHLDDWQLVGIDHANFARFLDPKGVPATFLIGQGDMADVQALPPPPKVEKPTKPEVKGKGPAKPPGTGGALLLPRLTDAPDTPTTPDPGTQQPRRRRNGGGGVGGGGGPGQGGFNPPGGN